MPIPRRRKFARRFGPSDKPAAAPAKDTNGADITRRRTVAGRRQPKRTELVKRLVQANTVHTYYRFTSLSSRMNGIATLKCGAQTNGTTNLLCPLYMFDLAALPNNVQSSQQVPYVAYRLTLDQALGSVQWVNYSGTGHTGTSTAGYVHESATVFNATTMNANAAAYWSWTSIALCLVGCTSNPVKFTVALVRLTDSEYEPDTDTSRTSGSKHTAAWQSEVKALTTHPLATQPVRVKRPYRVIKAVTWTATGTHTTANDADPDMRLQKLFYRANKTLRFDENGNPSTFSYATQSQPFAQQLGVNSTTPNALSKVYLMVKAETHATAADATGVTVANTPSFDIVLRTKLSQLSV